MRFSPARLQEELDRHLMSQSEAARWLDFPQRSLQRWLAGHAQPRRSAVRHMAARFNVEPASFYVEPEHLEEAA